MTDKNEMPEVIYAALGKDGGTYWVRERHEALDKSDTMPQTLYLRADIRASLPVDDLAKVREALERIISIDDKGNSMSEHFYDDDPVMLSDEMNAALDNARAILDKMGGK